MSKKRELDWHTWVIAGSAIIAMSIFFYLLQPLYKSFIPNEESQAKGIIESAYYDENCFVIILFSDGTYDRIPTDFRVSDPTIRCYQSKRIDISTDKKYLLFEGSDWHAEDAAGYYPGNYLGIYFASQKKIVIWPFGSAKVSEASIDTDNLAVFQAVYEEEHPIQFKKLSLPFIESHWEASVNPKTHEVNLIEGVVIR